MAVITGYYVNLNRSMKLPMTRRTEVLFVPTSDHQSSDKPQIIYTTYVPVVYIIYGQTKMEEPKTAVSPLFKLISVAY